MEAGRARYVIGNHEIGLIATALGVRPLSEFDSFVDVLDAPDRDDWVAWLCGRELVARGALGEQEFAMVHAASHPDWSLADLCDRARSAEAQLRAGPERVARWLS